MLHGDLLFQCDIKLLNGDILVTVVAAWRLLWWLPVPSIGILPGVTVATIAILSSHFSFLTPIAWVLAPITWILSPVSLSPCIVGGNFLHDPHWLRIHVGVLVIPSVGLLVVLLRLFPYFAFGSIVRFLI